MPYQRLYYHFVWTTKGRMPLISAQVEDVLFPAIRQKIEQFGGFTYTLNGTVDHVHLAVAVPVNITVADFIGQIKGSSAYIVNKTLSLTEPLRWQNEYGVFTFAAADLDRIKNYIDRQKQHHNDNALIAELEQTG
jgi:putative transposase